MAQSWHPAGFMQDPRMTRKQWSLAATVARLPALAFVTRVRAGTEPAAPAARPEG
jgi:hypothetical protein